MRSHPFDRSGRGRLAHPRWDRESLVSWWLSPPVATTFLAGMTCWSILGGFYEASNGRVPVWTPPGVCMALIGVLAPRRSPNWRTLAGFGVAALTVFAAAGVWCGYPLGQSLWTGLVTLGVAGGVLAAQHRFTPGDTWFTSRVQHLTLYGMFAAIGAIVVVYLGGTPGGALGGTGSLREDVRWFAVIFYMFVFGAIVATAVWHSPRHPHSRVRYPATIPLFAVLSAACIAAPFALPEYPLSWLLAVPAMWMGLTLTPRLAGMGLIFCTAEPLILRGSQLYRADESWLRPETVMQFMLCGAAVLTGILIILRENTARLEAEVAMTHAEAAAQTAILDPVVESMTDAVLILDEEGRELLVNPAAHALLGRRSAGRATSGRSWVEAHGLRDFDGAPLSPEQLSDLVQPPVDGSPAHLVTLPGPDGERRVVSAATRALRHHGQRVALVLLTDVTTAHERRRQLEVFAGAVARDLTGPLSEVVAGMSHAVKELRRGDLEAGVASLDRSRAAGRWMRSMIDDYLAYAVTRQGVLRPAAVALHEVTQECVAAVLDPATTEGGTPPDLEIAVPPDVVVRADPALVHRLISNLLGYAARHPMPGRPAQIRIAAGRAGSGWVHITVEDRGPGLSDEARHAVSADFTPALSMTSEEHPRVEMALALSRAIVVRHGGALSARERPGGGTIIKATLPAAHADGWEQPSG